MDQLFSNGVVNGIYSFHASAAAYAKYWNDSFWKQQSDQVKSISCRQVWQAFTQETIRSIAAASNYDLILSDNLKIDEVTKEAIFILGNNGLITAASNHSCSECTHEYKQTADTLLGENVAQQANIQIPSTSNDDYGGFGWYCDGPYSMWTTYMRLTFAYKTFSTVLMKIVLQNLQMQEGVYFVPSITGSMVQSAMFVAAPTKRLMIQRHALNIWLNEENIKVIVIIKKNLDSEEFYEDQMKDCHGSLLHSQMYNPMMK